MAKKKVTDQAKPTQNQEQIHQTTTMDDASEKLETLKSLNAMLLKETVERRQQVDSLEHSKGSLESELTRSVMEKESLQAELSRLGDRTLLLELERNLVSVFVAVQVNQHAGVIDKERDRLGREKFEIEKKLGSLEREMREVLREKSEIEKVRSEKESEIGLLKKSLSELTVEIDDERDFSSRVGRERDAMRADLDAQIEEINGLRLKLIETEKREIENQEDVRKLKIEYKGVVEENEERQRRIESMMRDKDSIGRSLEESNRVIEEMKREVEEISREKEAIQEDRNVQVMKKNELGTAVTALNEMVLSLQKEEDRLRANVVVLEKRCGEGLEKEKEMMMDIDSLVEEKKERERSFERLIEEKGLVMKNLDEAMKQLDEEKRKVEEIVREKIEMEAAKDRGEGEIVELQKQLAEFRDKVSSMEESLRGQVEEIKQLESEVAHYRDAFDCVTTERDEARKGFDGEKMNGMNLREKISEMEKSIEETHKVLGEMKAENVNLTGEKKELEKCCAMLMKDMVSMEKKLAETQKEFDDVQAKVGLADANSELILNMLKNTVALVRLSQEGRGIVESGIPLDQHKAGREIKPFVAELEAIKNAFKNKENKVEDMKQQLEFMHNSVAEAHKTKSFWTVISSAAILVAASVAYVARGR